MNKKQHLERIKQKCQELIEQFEGMPDAFQQEIAGWRSTIAAIDLFFDLLKYRPYINWDDSGANKSGEAIIAAWPEDLL